MVCQGQLHRLPNLLLLDVEATQGRVRDVGLLPAAQELDGTVRFWGEDFHQGGGMTMKSDGSVWSEKLTIDCGKNTNKIMRTSCGTNYTMMSINYFKEISNTKWNGSNSFHLLLCSNQL